MTTHRLATLTCLVPFLIVSQPAAQEQPKHSLTYLLEDKRAFARIPAGQFTMGSTAGNPDETPVHRVRISKPFEIGRYEITQAQWKAVMDDPHAKRPEGEEADNVEPGRFKGSELPVESVSWFGVQRFLHALNARDKRYTYRLPTEAEWEYAAAQAADGWCESSSGAQTHTIGQKPANKFGLHDMLGNVMEWVQDWYAADSYADRSAGADPQGAANGSYKIYRGGAWLSDSKQCRAEYRGFDLPANTHDSVGFRIVRMRR